MFNFILALDDVFSFLVCAGIPHKSHFSLPQALTYLLSLPTKPKRAILTDFTHRVEHYSTQTMLQEWQSKMRACRHASTPDWWQEVWNESLSEKNACLEVISTHRQEISEEEAKERVPSVEMGYDGQCIEFN